MTGKRKRHSAAFKAKVPPWRPPSRTGPSPSWRRSFRSTPSRSASGRSSSSTGPSPSSATAAAASRRRAGHVQAELYERIGRLNMEVEWLKKSVARCG